MKKSGIIIGSNKTISPGTSIRIGNSRTRVIMGNSKPLKSGSVVIVNGKSRVIVGGRKEIKSGDWVKYIRY